MVTNNNQSEFGFYKHHNVPVPKFNLGAEPLKEQLKETKVGPYRLVTINKKNIGVDRAFQRFLNKKQITSIKKNWDYENCDLPCLYVSQSEEGFHYQITDGQHRICAYPVDEIVCRVVNSKSSVKRCLEANNPQTKHSWSTHDLFWAEKELLEREDLLDENNILTIISAYENHGWTPAHPKKDKKVDIGSDIATVHKSIVNTCNLHLATRNWPKAEKRLATYNVINDVVRIMDEVFGSEIRAKRPSGFVVKRFGGSMWSSLAHVLSDDKKDFGFGFQYDVDEIIAAMKSGVWGPTKAKALSNIKAQDLKDDLNSYVAGMQYYLLNRGEGRGKIKGLTDRRANAMAKLIYDMVERHRELS